MIRTAIPLMAMVILAGIASALTGEPVFHWSGADGHDMEGRIQNAEWADCGTQRVLRLAAPNAGVEFDVAPVVQKMGPMTLEVWAYPAKRAEAEWGIAGKSFDRFGLTQYGDGYFYWYYGSGGNKCRATAKEHYWSHLTGVFDGERLLLYLNGALADSIVSRFPSIPSDGAFAIGHLFRQALRPEYTDSFQGFIASVRCYDRALPADEIQTHFQAERSNYRRMEPGLDRVRLALFPYTNEMYADIDLGNYAPLTRDQTLEVQVCPKDQAEPWRGAVIKEIPETGVIQDVKINIEGILPGKYDVIARVCQDSKPIAEDRKAVSYPLSQEMLGSQPAPPLPTPVQIPNFKMEIAPQGGFWLEVNGIRYAVLSSFSYPQGGENVLGILDHAGESEWRVLSSSTHGTASNVNARGKFYDISRQIERFSDHVLVKDTLTNLTDSPIGILFNHRIDASNAGEVFYKQYPNPAVFLSTRDAGLGLVALDDVYLEQQETFFKAAVGGIRSRSFALDANASYTLEWAVYLNGSGDYFDFLRAVRRDEGLIRTVDGGFAFMDRRVPPTKEYMDLRGIKYLSIGCLDKPVDDPGVGVEGMEFVEYPQECALLKQTFEETKALHPGVKVMFHIAHSLFTTNRPQELFADSRVLNSAGQQTDYGDNSLDYYGRYFSADRVQQGYRWFIFYPAPDNRFGKYMLNGIDYMLNDMGVNGMFADGYSHGYGGRFTYDRWDGHTAEIDAESKTIKRKYASVNLLADPVLVDVVRRINARGGVVIANSYPGTRTLHRENILYCTESGGGDQSCAHLYLAPTVIALGDPGRCATERGLYEDIRAKLEWGALYFYYGEKEVTRRTLAADMYPITVEDFRPGLIQGRERIITTRSGVFGWHGDRSLHQVYRFDGRGVRVPHGFMTTADAENVRTQMLLDNGESAVLIKTPIQLGTNGSINVVVAQYDAERIELIFNGAASIQLMVAQGVFAVASGVEYEVTMADRTQIVQAGQNGLSIDCGVESAARMSIRKH